MNLQQEGGHLILRVTPYDPRAVEGLPIVLRMTLENIGEEPASIFFKHGSEMTADDVLELRAIDSHETAFVIRRLSVLSDNRTRAAGASLAEGASLVTDLAVGLFVQPEGAPKPDAPSLVPLPPGEYRMNVTLRCPQVVQSEQFEVTVVAPDEADRNAWRLLEALPYYTQGLCEWPKPDASWALGGKPQEIVDRLVQITQDFGNSGSAMWLGYWKLYHLGPVDEAIRYAREHREFPLSDNLLQHYAEGLFKQQDYGRARELAAEILRDFPNGDTRARVEQLQEKLRNKP